MRVITKPPNQITVKPVFFVSLTSSRK